MLYYLFAWIEETYSPPGFGVFAFISFRGILSIITSLLISLFIGKRIIRLLQRRQVGEVVREGAIGPDHAHKMGTPTMGGLIIIASIIVPTLLWGDLRNAYVWLILVGTLWMGVIGFFDDYIKVFLKDKAGLKGKFKVFGQVSLGLLVGLVMLFHPDFIGSRKHLTTLDVIANPTVVMQRAGFQEGDALVAINEEPFGDNTTLSYEDIDVYTLQRPIVDPVTERDTFELVRVEVGETNRAQIALDFFGPEDANFRYRTDLPFAKNYVFDYSNVVFLKGYVAERWLGSITYLIVVIFIVTAVSNAVNLTDGIDGLAAGTSAVAGATLGIFAYLAGNAIFADYLNISYIPLSAELFIYATALVGACVGFLWYNAYPAQVFMGDTGSLTLGGALGILALMVKKELLLPIICGIFVAEALSVILQVTYFRYTKRRYGEGRRIFRMSPLHHHYEKTGLHESKIVTRFLIVAILMAALAFATLKLR